MKLAKWLADSSKTAKNELPLCPELMVDTDICLEKKIIETKTKNNSVGWKDDRLVCLFGKRMTVRRPDDQ